MKKTQFNSTIKILENKVSGIREQIKTIIASGENFHLLNDLHDEARDTEDEIKDAGEKIRETVIRLRKLNRR